MHFFRNLKSVKSKSWDFLNKSKEINLKNRIKPTFKSKSIDVLLNYYIKKFKGIHETSLSTRPDNPAKKTLKQRVQKGRGDLRKRHFVNNRWRPKNPIQKRGRKRQQRRIKQPSKTQRRSQSAPSMLKHIHERNSIVLEIELTETQTSIYILFSRRLIRDREPIEWVAAEFAAHLRGAINLPHSASVVDVRRLLGECNRRAFVGWQERP